MDITLKKSPETRFVVILVAIALLIVVALVLGIVVAFPEPAASKSLSPAKSAPLRIDLHFAPESANQPPATAPQRLVETPVPPVVAERDDREQTVHVKGHYRNGKWVEGYDRRAPTRHKKD